MEYEMEITERITHAVRTALEDEMRRGWSLEQLVPMMYTAIEEVIQITEGK